MPKQNLIPEIDYTTKDFNSIQDQLIRYIQFHYGDKITNFNESGQTKMLVELEALFGDILMFYLDRQANESFLSTATRRQSVIDHTSKMDYELKGATPVTGSLQITIDPSDDNFPGYPAVIPYRFAVSNGKSGDDKIQYETDTPIIFTDGETVKTASISEGRTVNETGPNRVGISDGTPNQLFKLSETSIYLPEDEDEFLRVFQLSVNGITWTRVEDLIDSLSTDQEYLLHVDELDQVTVEFGDGVLGKIPTAGDIIEATYRVVKGTSGRVGSNILTTIENQSITWVTAVINIEGTSGGSDRETIEEAKINAPRALSALNRAVSDEDHETIARSVSGVAKAKTGTTSGLEIPIYIAPVGAGNPSSSLINQVISAFKSKKMSPTVIRIISPFYQPVDVEYELHVNSAYKKTDVKESVDSLIENLFEFENVDFGTGIKLADLYKRIRSDVTGIDSFIIRKLTLFPTFRANANNTGSPVFSNLKVFENSKNREWFLQMTSNSTYSVKEREYGVSTTIVGSTLADENVSWLLASGTATGVATNTLVDNNQIWDDDQFKGQTLIDSVGAAFLIQSNNLNTITTVGTPSGGNYKVVRRFNGRIVNPNTSQDNTFTVLSNTENTLTLSQNIVSYSLAGNSYYIEKTQTNVGTLGVIYEDDDDSLSLKMTNGTVANVIGDSWTFRTTAFIDDISVPPDVIPIQGTFKSKVFGGKIG